MNLINHDSFWDKICSALKMASQEVIEKALWLYYAAQDPDVPAWAKSTIYSALAYFILPLDLIPDFVPGGYVDDLGVLAAAVASVSMYITEDVKHQATAKLQAWFGD